MSKCAHALLWRCNGHSVGDSGCKPLIMLASRLPPACSRVDYLSDSNGKLDTQELINALNLVSMCHWVLTCPTNIGLPA